MLYYMYASILLGTVFFFAMTKSFSQADIVLSIFWATCMLIAFFIPARYFIRSILFYKAEFLPGGLAELNHGKIYETLFLRDGYILICELNNPKNRWRFWKRSTLPKVFKVVVGDDEESIAIPFLTPLLGNKNAGNPYPKNKKKPPFISA
jgi:hypothetical protein